MSPVFPALLVHLVHPVHLARLVLAVPVRVARPAVLVHKVHRARLVSPVSPVPRVTPDNAVKLVPMANKVHLVNPV